MTERGLSKQLLCNFQTENSCDRKQLNTEVKNGVAYKKACIWEVLCNECTYWKGAVCLKLWWQNPYNHTDSLQYTVENISIFILLNLYTKFGAYGWLWKKVVPF